jgi:hypothetical protein
MRAWPLAHKGTRVAVKAGGLLCMLSAGCSGDQTKAPKTERAASSAQVATDSDSIDKAGAPVLNAELNGALLDAKYQVSAVVTSANGKMGACGPKTFPLKVNAAFGESGKGTPLFEISNAVLPCQVSPMNMEINLEKILGSFMKNPAKPNLKVESDVIFTDRLGEGVYKPERPLFPSFLASKAENLASLDYTRDGIVLSVSSTGASATGKVRLHTTSFGKPDSVLAGTFDNVLKFETEVSGFEDVKILKVTNLLPKRMEWRIAFDPLAIIGIRLVFPATALIKAGAYNPGTLGGPLDEIFGVIRPILDSDATLRGIAEGVTDQIEVTIDLELEDQEGLKK